MYCQKADTVIVTGQMARMPVHNSSFYSEQTVWQLLSPDIEIHARMLHARVCLCVYVSGTSVAMLVL